MHVSNYSLIRINPIDYRRNPVFLGLLVITDSCTFLLVPIHKLFSDTGKFPIQKRMNFDKFKEIKGLCGGVLKYIPQVILQIDAEIVKKGRLWMETNYVCLKHNGA